MLYSLIISPIETVVSWIFNFFTIKFAGFGIIGAVCGVSLAVNFLALPLYNIADSLQEKERKIAKALEPGIKRIKAVFKGDEQFMILSTFYRQNHYHPLYVLRSSLSILIEIPFFIAAYHFLSNCDALKGSSFWIFKDLGSPDGLLHIGSFPIHILPIIMTLINFVSGAIYTKNAVFREKIQLYVIAVLFLALLYNSPSGLVIYWILNNIFSLIKNIVMKTKCPGKILHASISFLLLFAAVYFFTGDGALKKKVIFLLFALLVTSLPFITKFFSNFISFSEFKPNKTDFLILLFSGIGLAVLCGFVIPSSVISTSVAEFSFLGSTDSPIAYVKSNCFIFLGFFVLWPLVIYKMFGPLVKKCESVLFFVLFIFALANVFIFKTNYGDLSILFEVENESCFDLTKIQVLLSVLSFVFICLVYFVFSKFKKENILSTVTASGCFALVVLGGMKVSLINNEFKLLEKNRVSAEKVVDIKKEYNLSKTGKNVVVLFLDRAINSYAQKIFEEFPQIKKQFEGFTYYPNTLSFSTSTVTGAPPMLGGYEYSQEKMNARSDEKLRDKNNEALLVMSKLFVDAGFEVTATDLPWPNYYGKGDLDFCKKVSEAKVSEIAGKYYYNFYNSKVKNSEIGTKADVFCKTACIDFSVMQILPPFAKNSFYGNFRREFPLGEAERDFYAQFSNLYYLPQMTDFSSQKDTFTFLENETPHKTCVILNDDFESVAKIQKRNKSLQHYHINVASLKQVGKWMDYLRENDVYNNTRIIIVSDHGYEINIPCKDENVASFSALLLVKDFNSRGELCTNNDFMTNADTLFFAKEGLNVSNINPFTKNKFVQEKSNGINVYTCVDWNPAHFRDAKQFELDENQAFHVSSNIYKKENWIPLTEWKQRK